MRRLFAVAAGILALAGCSNGSDAAAEETTVARVIDGDTIETGDGDRVRLVQIDAPEADEGECYAQQAAAAVSDLIPPGTVISLESDPRLDDVDRFGRLLRYVHTGEENVNLELVRAGAASVWFFRGDRGRYAEELLDVAREAARAGRGLWAACPGTRLTPGRPVDTG